MTKSQAYNGIPNHIETIQYERKMSYIKKIMNLGQELCKAFGYTFNIENEKDTPQINLLGKSSGEFQMNIMYINIAIEDISNNKKITKETIIYLENLHNSYDI